MRFIELKLKGSYLIEIDEIEDQRGFFARTYCEKEFAAMGLASRFVQSNISFNAKKNTLRGLHYQAEPCEEEKLVRCTFGAIYDVLVDLRPESQTYLQWCATELTCENRLMVFIPKGFAHGFQTLCEKSEVLYLMSEFFKPDMARGIRWNDPSLRIDWLFGDPILSDRDRRYPDLIT